MNNRQNTLVRKVKSNDLLEKLSHITNRLTKTATDEFSDLSEAQMYWNPDKSSWSIAQCMAHLNAFHRFYVPVFVERIQNSRFQEPDEFFQSSPLGNATYVKVKLGKLKNVKRKLKSQKDYNPLVNTNLDTADVIKNFIEYQSQLIVTLEGARKINIRKTKMSFSKRPIVRLRVGDAFQYIVYHCERHIEQARKVKANKRFPAT
ncbi:MAG: hypothetical protein ACI857_002880 [Arenicella sp.]|jgi:hypothetical protein